MNQCVIQQKKSFVGGGCEDMMRPSVVKIRESVVCPKLRRLGGLIQAAAAGNITTALDEPPPPSYYVRPLIRWHASHHREVLCDSKAGNELLDIIILSKGGRGADQSTPPQVASLPPFFFGSPPSRVSNPLIQDSWFGDDGFTPVSPRAIPVPSGLAPSPSSSTHKGGCVRGTFGNNPTVRIEGFDCLDGDSRRNCSIPALA